MLDFKTVKTVIFRFSSHSFSYYIFIEQNGNEIEFDLTNKQEEEPNKAEISDAITTIFDFTPFLDRNRFSSHT